jgi:hypothetical protein
MRGEDAPLLHPIHCFFQVLSLGQLFAQQFQSQERGVAFIHVEDSRPDIERAQ